VARYNEILVGRYNRFLQKFLSMKGGPPAPQLASEIGPTIALFSGVENRYLEQFELFAATTTLAASVGNNGAVQIRNPANSNVIAVIEKITVSTTAAGEIVVSVGSGIDLVTFTAVARGDGRSRANPAMIASASNAALTANLGNLIWRNFVPANTASDLINDENQEIPLTATGGTGAIRITSSSANVGVSAAIWWRERLLEESERT
jgi:hypothetical protein